MRPPGYVLGLKLRAVCCAGLLRSISVPHHGMAAPTLPPVLWIEGTPPLVRCAAFENKRHVLTKDAAGVVALWDLVYGKAVKAYSPDKVRRGYLYVRETYRCPKASYCGAAFWGKL